MFDDKPIGPVGQTPQNLPLGEPEDVFADTAEFVPVADAASGASPTGGSTSALDAGILKPREATASSVPSPLPSLSPIHIGSNSPGLPPVPSSAPQMTEPPIDSFSSMNTLKEPTMSRGIMVGIIVILGVLLVGGAAWWVFQYLNVPEENVIEEVELIEEVPILPPEAVLPVIQDDTKSETVSEPIDESFPVNEFEATSTVSLDESLLFGDSPDTDADGLDDKRESTLGTDPLKTDTDNDELSDGDEVIIWGTNPLNSDTDGDTYLDGKEVKAGFSPKGSGKLFEVKSSSTSTLTTN